MIRPALSQPPRQRGAGDQNDHDFVSPNEINRNTNANLLGEKNNILRKEKTMSGVRVLAGTKKAHSF
jgi:hypothetical protein